MLQKIGWATPNTWALEAYTAVFWRGRAARRSCVLPVALLLVSGVAGTLVALGSRAAGGALSATIDRERHAGTGVRWRSASATLLGMEAVAYLMHRYLMHGPLWFLHESHHRPRRSPLEWNDLFGAFFATPSIVLIYLGTHGHPFALAASAWA